MKRSLIRHVPQLAVIVIGPAMETTDESADITLRMNGDLIAAMQAHVVEGPQLILPIPGDDDRRITDRQILYEIITGILRLVFASDAQPALLEDQFLLALKDRFAVVVLQRNQSMSQRFTGGIKRCCNGHWLTPAIL